MQDLNNTKKKKDLKTRLLEFDWLTVFLGIIVVVVFLTFLFGAIFG